MKSPQWFRHAQHGFMLRTDAGQFDGHEYEHVVTGLTANDADVQADPAAWERHKSRLHVNAGCGAVSYELMRKGDRNPAFVPVAADTVPPHIVRDFGEDSK